MEEIKKHQPGTFCWLELGTDNPEEAKKFYSGLFGWEINDLPVGEGMTYTMLQVNGKPVGALYELNEEQRKMQIPPHWMPYISVENAAETVSKAKELGAEIVMEAFDVMEEGRMGMFKDVDGAFIAIWEPKNHIGTSYKFVPGAMCWQELGCKNRDKVITFYEKLFGWSSKTEQMGEMEYTTFTKGEEMTGGLYVLPPELGDVPPNWLSYILVVNIDETLKKAESTNGKILMPKTFIPGVGHFSVLQDPQGAVFGVLQGAEK